MQQTFFEFLGDGGKLNTTIVSSGSHGKSSEMSDDALQIVP